MVEIPSPKPNEERDLFDGVAELERLLGLRPSVPRKVNPCEEINQETPTDEEIHDFIYGKQKKTQPPDPVPLK